MNSYVEVPVHEYRRLKAEAARRPAREDAVAGDAIPPGLLSSADVAKLLGVSRGYVSFLVRAGRLRRELLILRGGVFMAMFTPEAVRACHWSRRKPGRPRGKG